MIQGIITGKSVLQNYDGIAKEFGLRVLFGCLVACASRKPTTFLNIVFDLDRQNKSLLPWNW